tara:strand:- start:2693 stop:2875 length:183 start_codon:yes stop_codon:yes gene_type:complete
MEYYLRTDKVEIDDHGIATVKMALNICNCPKDDCNKDRLFIASSMFVALNDVYLSQISID